MGSGRLHRRQHARVHGLVLGLVLSALALGATAARAQGWPVAPRGITLQTVSEHRFDASSGLHATTAFAIAVDSKGVPWLAADDGLYRYANGSWIRETIAAEFANQQVRSLVISADDTRWLGTRRGLLRLAPSGTSRVFRESDGLAGQVVYSLIETRAIDGTPRVVAGTSRGASWFDGTRFVPLDLPGTRAWVGVMVAAGTDSAGAPTLWAANSAGGVARYQRGQWRAYGTAEGLASPDAQFVLPLGDAIAGEGAGAVYVASADGVNVLARGAARFSRMPGSPPLVSRLTEVPGVDGRRELWAGTVDGALYRYRDAVWTHVSSSVSDRRGSVSLLSALVGSDSSAAIYASSRNGYLVRLRYGAAASLPLPLRHTTPGVTATAVAPAPDGPDRLWVGTQDDGLLEIGPDGGVRRFPFVSSGPWGVVTSLSRVVIDAPASTAGADTSLLVLAKGVPFRQTRTSFEPMRAGLEGAYVSQAQRLQLPNGTWALLAATSRGVRQWSGSRWEAVPGLDEAPATSLLDGVEQGTPVLYVGGAHAVRIFGRAGLRTEAFPRIGSSATGIGIVTRICRTGPAGDPHLFALDAERGVFWRHATTPGAWHLFPTAARSTLVNQGVLNMQCLRDGRLAISTFGGLSIFDVSAADSAAWRSVAQISDADGLPSILVKDMLPSGQARYLWATTPYGVGLVDLRRAEQATPSAMLLQLSMTASGRTVDDGSSLDVGENDLRLEPQLLTFHREESTRFLVEIVRTAPWYFGGGRHAIGADGGEVIDVASRVYHDLAPGRYDVAVTGFDWSGRPYGPVRRHFDVRTPLGLRWYALLAYAALLVSALTTAYRVRVRTIRAAADRLLESERRARDSERRFRTLFEQALDAHLLLADGRVQAANDQAAVLFGVDHPARLAERTLGDLFADGTETFVSGDAVVRRGDLLVPVHGTVSEVPTETGQLQHLVLRDLTAAREAEAQRAWFERQVREAQKLESLGTLAGGVAHDFNNLLGVVRGNAELAKAALKHGRGNEEHLAAILDASDRAREIVRQILTFSRRSTPTREFVNLSALIVDLQPLLRRMVPRTVRIEIEGTETPHIMMADPTQLQQLLLNLVSNAEYALRSRSDGMLTIAVSSRDDSTTPTAMSVVLQVRDNGDGMTEDVRSRIFEPFFTTKPTGEGTGLGMAVVHGIVMSHEGRAEVASAPGAGTTFEICFPRAEITGLFDDDDYAEAAVEAAAEVAAEVASEAQAVRERLQGAPTRPADAVGDADFSRFAGSQIVVVDDEPGVARVVERALEESGHVVHVFLTPEPALAFIREHVHTVDLLITDQTMPGMTGDELTAAVKAMRDDLPVLILTGYSHRLTAARVAAVKARAVLTKPVELDALRRAVDDALAAGASA